MLMLPRLARMRYVSLLCAALIAFLPFLSFDLYAQSAPHPNQIIPDGRTQTGLQTSGNVTNVTTSTVSGPNAFNSFSQFGVGQGNTVNLQLPSGSQNLINIVRDAPAYVNGTLNSYANGKIGGNVYFADPQGFVVGATGTVNVGSLNVSTPTREFTDKLIGAQGQINGAAVSSLMNGSFPISPDGNIRILGRVNAADGVRLTGQNVSVGPSTSQRERVNQDHAAQFAASVNSKGLHSASSIVVRNGSIHIVAAGNAKVSGRLVAHSRGTTPSTISVAAGKNIQIAKTANLSTASKKGDAGNIALKADGDLTVASGAAIDASSTIGNAGLVELSAKGTATIGQINLNLAAPNGAAGTLLIDPYNLVIGDPNNPGAGSVLSTNSDYSYSGNLITNGANVVLSADNSITIANGGIIDTRQYNHASALSASNASTGNSGSITLNAPNITVNGQLLADVVNTSSTHWAAGDVTLEEDLIRRDLTINAIAQAEDGTLLDPFGGRKDLQEKIFRHVSSAFAEDPVRILRVARFAERFTDFAFAPETMALMRRLDDIAP